MTRVRIGTSQPVNFTQKRSALLIVCTHMAWMGSLLINVGSLTGGDTSVGDFEDIIVLNCAYMNVECCLYI